MAPLAEYRHNSETILDANPRSSHASPMYKPHFQLYKLYKMDHPFFVADSLSLGGAGFVYSAILNPLPKTTLIVQEL